MIIDESGAFPHGLTRGLPAYQERDIKSMSTEPVQRSIKAGGVIFNEGDAVDYAYVIEDGNVEISVQRDGTRVVLEDLGPGEFFGEMAVVDQYTRTATATVSRDCRLSVITPQQIRQRIEAADPIVRTLLRLLLSRHRSEVGVGVPLEAASALFSSFGGAHRVRLENELVEALDTGSIKVAYQPIIDLKSGSLVGFEALVRWEHPRRGSVPSEALVSLAEEASLILPLGLHVFKTAVTDLARFQRAGNSELFVSINVSPKHTADPEFVARALELCAEAGQPPARVMLELTESVQVDFEALQRWTEAVKAGGFRLTVDDFGTGFATLEYLTRLAPDTVKIDRGVVRPMPEDARTQSVVRRVLQMARDLEVSVIAEGAESARHLTMLKDMGCDMAQGYEIGRPLTSTQVESLLTAS